MGFIVAGAGDLPEFDELEAERFDHGEHAVQRGTVY
jgi:hypothetical protein